MAQRPLVKFLDAEWEKRSTRINKEQTVIPQNLPPPIGVQPSPQFVPSSEEDRKTLQETLNKEVRKVEVKKDMKEAVKKQFSPLPPKEDPNL